MSTKGQVVLPSPIRRKLGLRPGDPLDANIEGESVVLTPQKKGRRKAKIIVDRRTGLPAITLARGAPVLTSKEVEEILAEFP
jgi:AbrB family looped-hinge helix DNA binding protein